MRKITVIVLMLFTALSYAQVGINIATPHASSALDITSTTGGLLVPRMTEVQRDDINSSSNPAIGLMIYQTDGIAGFYFWNGSAWTKIDGVAGPQGPAGADGADGAQGPAGPAGVVGSAGPVGSTGAQGLAGPVGTQGPAGAQGPAGPVGPQGIQGIQGDIGLTGATGPSGSNGPAGIQGAQGEQGPQGIQGETGATGSTGATGPQGIQGVAGTDGADGTNGTNGSSAYEIWVAAGNTGTEAEFLASLVGAQGETGAQGPQGIQGESYPQTDQGYVLSGSCTVPGATAYNSDTGQTVVCKPYLVTDGSQQFLITNELACPDNSEGTTTNNEYWISFEVSQPLVIYSIIMEPFANNSYCGNVAGDFKELYKVESNQFSSSNNLGNKIWESGSNITGIILYPGFTYSIRLAGIDGTSIRTTSVSNYTINNLFNNVKFYTSSPNSFSLNETLEQWALLYNYGNGYINGNILTVFSDWEFRWESF